MKKETTTNTKKKIVLLVTGGFVLLVSSLAVLESLFGSKKKYIIPNVIDVGDGIITFEKK